MGRILDGTAIAAAIKEEVAVEVRALAEQFSAKPAEIRQFLRGELSSARAQELSQRMQAAGLPI